MIKLNEFISSSIGNFASGYSIQDHQWQTLILCDFLAFEDVRCMAFIFKIMETREYHTNDTKYH